MTPRQTSSVPLPSRDRLAAFARCTVALAATLAAYWLLNYAIFPACDRIWLWTREVSAAGGGFGLVAFAFCAWWAPQHFTRRRILAMFLFCALLGSAGLALGLALLRTAPLVAGATLLTLALGLVLIIVGVAASALSLRAITLCSAVSYCAAYALRSLFAALPQDANCLLFILLPTAGFALCLPRARAILDQPYTAGSPAEIALTTPSAVLPFEHRFFVTLLVFRFVYGYTLAFGEVERTPSIAIGALVPLGLLLVWAVLRKRAVSPDTLFKLSILFSVAGFLLIAAQAGLPRITIMILSCGTGFFEVFMFSMLAALAGKNSAAALSLFAWGGAMGSWGTLLGANFGRLANETASHALLASPTATLIVFALVAYIVLLKGTFNFAATIQQIAPTAPVVLIESEEGAQQLLHERCRDLGREHNLTKREQQIFEYLARGRNVRFIEEELVVSYNTVKTHVSHIYAKLGVHSHQELIDLVEQGK